MKKQRRRLLIPLWSLLLVALQFSCSRSSGDPLIGQWELSPGSVVTFETDAMTVSVEDIDPFYGASAGSTWSTKWKRDSDTIIIQPPDFASGKGTRSFRVIKASPTDLVLKSTDEGLLLLGTRKR